MGWRSTGAAFRAGNYSGPLTSDEGGFASGFAKTFTAGISKASDIIAGEMQAEREQKREEDLIRLRETLAAQRAAATSARKTEAADSKAIAWAVGAVQSMNLDNSPEVVSQLSALYVAEGGEVQAGNALRKLVEEGSINLAPRTGQTATPPNPAAAPEATVELSDTTMSSRSEERPVYVFNQTEPDNLEATEPATAVTAAAPAPVMEDEPPATPTVTPAESVTTAADFSITPQSAGESTTLNILRDMDLNQLRTERDTRDPESYRGQAARQLYQDRRTREIQNTSEEATLITIVQNGEDWERDAARSVLQTMRSSTAISRLKVVPEGGSISDIGTTGADVINVRKVLGDDGVEVHIDVATGQPVDRNRVVGEVTQDESERLVAILTAMNNPITTYQSQLKNLLGFADLAYEIGQIIEEDETVTTKVAGFVSAIVSGGREASAIYNVLSTTFANNSDAVVTQQDLERELRRNGTLQTGETIEAVANRMSVEDIFNDETIDLAERRRIFDAKMVLAAFRAGGMEGQSGQAMSNKDFERFSQFLNSARTNEGFKTSVGEYLNNSYRQTMQMENNLLNDGRVTEFRSMYFRDPLNLTTMSAAVEAEPRYRDALAYFGIIVAPQQAAAPAQSPEPQQTAAPAQAENAFTLVTPELAQRQPRLAQFEGQRIRAVQQPDGSYTIEVEGGN